ncbi:hypothetical protein Pcinc_029611 [Petrolisthes cinctipes]|uniref:Secreted protein n=1 Tax=Petrolisthes cinctipes TaxID=88211 RepID=A0AAE1K5H2_PETCI|nr:hypothetical protein Pcinc_029611 [Petrolisthes cinctipes]
MLRLVSWAMCVVWVCVCVVGVVGQRRASNPLLIFGHLLQGLDPSGPPRLLEDDSVDEDDFEDYFDDEDVSPFSFFG